MEKFYIVTEESSLRKEYLDYKENLVIISKTVKEFFEKHGIETTGYCAYNEQIAIDATENDAEKYKSVLNKDKRSGLRFFKKNSKINKDWIKTLLEKNLKVLHKPMLGFCFEVFGRCTTRLFDYKGNVYCSMSAEYDFKNPKGLVEIKASEFYKIIEDAEKGDK